MIHLHLISNTRFVETSHERLVVGFILQKQKAHSSTSPCKEMVTLRRLRWL